mgnify:CR=1 FL=1
MYIKNTPEFILLEKLYRAYKGAIDPSAPFLGIAKNKFESTNAVISTLKIDGYLVEIPRERWIALWITLKGIADYEAFRVSDVPPPPPPDLELDRAIVLKQKLIAGTITSAEKVELTDIILKRISL